MGCDIDYFDYKNALSDNQIYQLYYFFIFSFVTLILGILESCFCWKKKIKQNEVLNMIDKTPGTLALTEIETPLSYSSSSVSATSNSYSNLFHGIPPKDDEDDSDNESDISFVSMSTSCTNMTNTSNNNTRSSYHPIVK